MFFNRAMIADVFAMITFSLVVGMSVELLAGLSLEQSVMSRLLSIPVNLIIARPYGLYRDWMMLRGRVWKGGFVRLTLLDALAYLSFQTPVYAVLVASTGAGLDQVLAACAG